MPNNLARFTRRARRVLAAAQAQAESFQHPLVDTAHLLLALLREDKPTAIRIRRAWQVEAAQLEVLIAQRGASGDRPGKAVQLSPDSKQALQRAVDDTRRMGQHLVDSQQLLMGLLGQPESLARQLLGQLGVSAEAVRQLYESIKAGPPIAIRSVPPPITYVPPETFRLLENVLLKALAMVENDQLTYAQTVELFNSLSANLRPATTYSFPPVSPYFDAALTRRGTVHVTLTNATDETVFSDDLALSQVLQSIDAFLAAMLNNPTETMHFSLGSSRLELQLKTDPT